jgi:hypothetical protein
MLTDSGAATRYIAPGTYNIGTSGSSTPAITVSTGEKTLIAATGSAGVTLKRASGFTGVLISITGGTLNLNTATPPTGAGTLTIDGGATYTGSGNYAAEGDFTAGSYSASNPLLLVDGGALKMYANSTVQNNYSTSPGGGIRVNAGEFTMYSGSVVRQNRATNGGGVYLWAGYGNVAFIMEGGTITHNATNTSYSGGGVYIRRGSSGDNPINAAAFTMIGGTISGNGSQDGGGVYVFNDGATFTMSGNGGFITLNNVTRWGGGVYSQNGDTSTSGALNPENVTGNTLNGSTINNTNWW